MHLVFSLDFFIIIELTIWGYLATGIDITHLALLRVGKPLRCQPWYISSEIGDDGEFQGS